MSSFHGHATETLVTLNQYFHDLSDSVHEEVRIITKNEWKFIRVNRWHFLWHFWKKKPSNYLIDLEAFANSFNKRVHYVNTKIWTMCQ